MVDFFFLAGHSTVRPVWRSRGLRCFILCKGEGPLTVQAEPLSGSIGESRPRVILHLYAAPPARPLRPRSPEMVTRPSALGQPINKKRFPRKASLGDTGRAKPPPPSSLQGVGLRRAEPSSGHLALARREEKRCRCNEGKVMM